MARGKSGRSGSSSDRIGSIARKINLGIDRMEKVNSIYHIYETVPSKVTSEYIRNHVGSQDDIDAWELRADAMYPSKGYVEFKKYDVNGTTVTVPVPEKYNGEYMPASEAYAARAEQARQDERARKLKEEYGKESSDGEQFQEWGDEEFDPYDVFSNNVNVQSHFEMYLSVIADNDDMHVLSETVSIVNWLLDNAVWALKKIYESGEQIPQIEYVYWQLVHYQETRRRAAMGVKARKTKNGESSVSNALNSLNHINKWWLQQFSIHTGERWSMYDD